LKQLPDEDFDYVITLGDAVPSYQRRFPRAQIGGGEVRSSDEAEDMALVLRIGRFLS
jgi:hypothetical protein